MAEVDGIPGFTQFTEVNILEGFLLPRLTTTERDAVTALVIGLQIYNTTTDTLEIYNGTEWLILVDTASDQDITGNWTFSEPVGFGTLSPVSQVDVNGSVSVKRVSSAVNVDSDDEVIFGIDSSSTTVTVTILTADIVAGRLFIIKDESGDAGSNNITVATEMAETIDGQATASISVNFGSLRLYTNGTNLFSW